MLDDVLKNNEAVRLKDEDLEQVTGGSKGTVGAVAGATSVDMAQGNIDLTSLKRIGPVQRSAPEWKWGF